MEGGTDRWNELSQDKTSDELVDVLLAEMTGQDIAIIQAGVSTGAEYFQGQVHTHLMFVIIVEYHEKDYGMGEWNNGG